MNDFFLVAPILFFLGAVIGSFLNVVALRFLRGEEIVFTPSHCPHCKHRLAWFELIPVVSFIVLAAKCRVCKMPISVQYPIVELLMGIVSLCLFWPLDVPFYTSLQAVLLFGAVSFLVVLVVIDSKTFILPDMFIVVLGVISFIYFLTEAHTQIFLSMIAGAGVGAGFLYLLWLITKGQGIGFGDIKLMVPLGFLLGFKTAIVCLLIAFVVGGLVGSILLLTKKATLKTAIPFGPYLAGAGILLLVLPQLTNKMIMFLSF